MNSSVAAWSGPARMKHVGMAFVQLLEAEEKQVECEIGE